MNPLSYEWIWRWQGHTFTGKESFRELALLMNFKKSLKSLFTDNTILACFPIG